MIKLWRFHELFVLADRFSSYMGSASFIHTLRDANHISMLLILLNNVFIEIMSLLYGFDFSHMEILNTLMLLWEKQIYSLKKLTVGDVHEKTGILKSLKLLG